MYIEEQFEQTLLVEGNSDQHVIWAICKKHDLLHNFDVVDSGSKTEVLRQLQGRLTFRNKNTIGIILDADFDVPSTWDSFRNLIDGFGFSSPENIPNGGFISSVVNNIKVGIWIMPNNTVPGILEDFISFLVPSTDGAFPKVKSFLDVLEKEKHHGYKPKDRSKAEFHNWLSLQKSPGSPLGLAITLKYLDVDNPECMLLIHWLSKLFS